MKHTIMISESWGNLKKNTRALQCVVFDSVQVTWDINDGYTATLTVYDNNQPDFLLVATQNSVLIDGQEYIIKQIEPDFSGGVTTYAVTLLHIMAERLNLSRSYGSTEIKWKDWDGKIHNPDAQEGRVLSDIDINADDSKDTDGQNQQTQSDEQLTEMTIDEFLKYWSFPNAKIGWKVHGEFGKGSVDKNQDLQLSDALDLFKQTWPSAFVVPDNSTLHIYTDKELFKDRGNRLDYLHDTNEVTLTYDTTELANGARLVGATYTYEVNTGGGDGGDVSDGPTEPINGDWGPVIKYAAQLMDVPIDDNGVNLVKAQIKRESGGNEQIVQGIWDVNMANGNPAQGLLQFIPQTFNYYAVEGHKNIKSGFDQLLAAFNIPNFLGQISGLSGWSPHGAPRSKTIIKQPAPKSTWGWPFRGMNGAPTSWDNGQQFGHTGWIRPGSGGSDFHDGFDFGSAHYSGDILCVHGGTVTSAGYQAGFMVVTVKSSDGLTTVYQEFGNSVSVRVGQNVKTGDVIGRLTTSHLHLGITTKDFATAFAHSFDEGGGWLDPIKTIQSKGGGAKGQSAPVKKSRADEYKQKALAYKGQPYKWGGTVSIGPHPTDCSGLYCSLALEFGVPLQGRSTYQIIKEMRPISRSEVQTGDAGFKPDLSHVVVALDNKTLIQESSENEPCNVRSIDGYYSPLNWYRYDKLASALGGDGAADDSNDGRGGQTKSYTVSYFTPFWYQNKASVDRWGLFARDDITSDKITTEDKMKKYADTQFKLNPEFSLEMTLDKRTQLPSIGDITRVEIKPAQYVAKLKLVGFSYYPFSDTSLDTVTYNSKPENILDYFNNQRKVLTDVQNRIKNSLEVDKSNREWLKSYIGGETADQTRQGGETAVGIKQQ